MRLFFNGIKIILLFSSLFVLSLFIPHPHNEMEIFISPNTPYQERLSSFSKVAYTLPRLLINPTKIKFGVYKIKKNCSYMSIFRIISYNKQSFLPFKIKNGMSLIQIKEEMLQNQNFRGKFPENMSEGMIIPDTYHFAYGIQRSKAIQYMLQRSKAKRDKLWKEYQKKNNQLKIETIEWQKENIEAKEELKRSAEMREKDVGISNGARRSAETGSEWGGVANGVKQSAEKNKGNGGTTNRARGNVEMREKDVGVSLHKDTNNKLKEVYKSQKENIELINYGIFKDEQEWIIFASILEKEGISYEDKQKIAGVILNRMKKKMRLEIDATAIYIKTNGKYDKKLRWNEIQSGKFDLDDSETISYKSPYNTYRNKGLPPGPICNPSIESLSAALNPEKHKYLYYRVIEGNKHVFSENFEQHKSLVREKNSNNKAAINK